MIDRKARRIIGGALRENGRELHAEEKEGTEPVSPVSIISNGLPARRGMSPRWYLCTSAPLRSLLIRRLSMEINKNTKKKTCVITLVIVPCRFFFSSSRFVS